MNGKRLLVVDDETQATTLLKLILESEIEGCSVLVAHDGLEAVDTADRCAPHAVVMDLEMPKLDGERAARLIAKHSGDAHPLLIALSGNVHRLAAMKIGDPFQHLLSKPVDMDELLTILR